MPRAARALALFILCLVTVPVLAAPDKPKETARYGVFLLNSRIGSMVTKTFDTTWEMKPAVRLESETSIKLQALGTVEQRISMDHVLTKKGQPLHSLMVMTSLGRTTRIDARYTPQNVVCNLDAGGQKSTKTVAIPKGVTLSGDPDLAGSVEDKPLKVGQKDTLYFFEPLSLTIQKVETEVVKSEERPVGGKKVLAFLVKTTNSITGASETWVDTKGGLLENNSTLGLRIVREDVPAAPSTLAYNPPKDFAVATSIKTAVKLPNARRTGLLKVRISGIPDEDLILSDSRQRVPERAKEGGKWAATYLVQSRELPKTGLPPAAADARGPGLGDAPYLGIADPGIRKQAKELAAGEPDRVAIARKVRAWVKGHMQRPNNIGTPRSAAEIMTSRDGVCRDYATLFAAVARAAGVPTRICSGIVYFQDGFFYHAWVECQLAEGEDGWFAFDPTLEDDFVDATHVKFAQGDPAEMYAAVRVVGQIQGEILEHQQ